VAAAAAPDLLGRLEVPPPAPPWRWGGSSCSGSHRSDVVGCADRPGAAARRRRGRGLPARRPLDAALGVLRDEPRTTGLATAALVLFTVVQSFAVFAPVLSGATCSWPSARSSRSAAGSPTAAAAGS
jgi:hypothetical protein